MYVGSFDRKGALLIKFKALLVEHRALLVEYGALLIEYRVLLKEYRARTRPTCALLIKTRVHTMCC